MGIQKGKKVFISSTAYDLIDLRAEVVEALTQWGFITINHESPNFPVPQGIGSHDICLEAVKHCDIFLLIIDKRYGSFYKGDYNEYKSKKNWSITRCEADFAFRLNKGHYTFVRTPIFYERTSYSNHIKEKGNSEHFVPTHAAKIEVLEFLDDIHKRLLADRKDNWITSFSHSVELKHILKGRLIGDDDIFQVPYDGITHAE